MNSDLIFNASSLTPALCSRCCLPMKSFVHHPTKQARMFCPRCDNEKFKLNYKELVNVNPDGYKEAKIQYKTDWNKLD